MKLARLPLFAAVLAPLAGPGSPPHGGGDAVQESRDLAGIAEEQALLRRQLQRLESTMLVLLDRIEAEGRTRTTQLLREGLELLKERSDVAGTSSPLTVEELMDLSRGSIEKGQLVQSLERQEGLITQLERLLGILMDRENLESLEESIDELRALQASLSELVDREKDLQGDTRGLREKASNEAQERLEAGIDRLLEAQRRMLDAGERLGRESGTLELELLERELAGLIHDQETDTAVLASWAPEEAPELAAVRELLDRARQGEARSARLGRAAETLRRVASEIEGSQADAEPSPWTDQLESAATREDRHHRVSGDPAAERAAQALREGAELVRRADPATSDPGTRRAAAEGLRRKADELGRAATEARAPATTARDEALRELDQMAERRTAAGAAAGDVRDRLEEARRAELEGASPDEVAQKTEEAARELADGLEEVELLGRALAESQSANAERAERIRRGLSTLAPGRTEAGRETLERLTEAAEAMRAASSSARDRDAPGAGRSAQEALEALERAAGALGKAREGASEEVAREAREGARAQGDLADRAGALEPLVEQGSMSPSAQDQVRGALGEAAEAMQQASEDLAQGRSASAANGQRQAMEALRRAAKAAEEGVTPTSPQDVARAQELAAEQEQIREDLIDLARRIQERENARSLPSLERADAAAQQATSSLEEGSLSEAEAREEEVERELQETLQELQEEEDQYEKLRQEEILFRIAEEVQTLLERHGEQMEATREIDAGRERGEAPSRAQKLRLRRISREEDSLGTRAGEIAEAILAEHSQVTAQLMADVESDLHRIARDLGQEGDFRTGERVQARQRDVDEALHVLLEALRQEQRRRRQDQQDQQDQQQQEQNQPPLVPDATELKLLRRMEIDVADGVDQLLILHPELRGGDPLDVDPLTLEEIQRLASRHERITELFAGFRERMGLEPPEDGGDGGDEGDAGNEGGDDD